MQLALLYWYRLNIIEITNEKVYYLQFPIRVLRFFNFNILPEKRRKLLGMLQQTQGAMQRHGQMQMGAKDYH
jgi:hypothetical protein